MGLQWMQYADSNGSHSLDGIIRTAENYGWSIPGRRDSLVRALRGEYEIGVSELDGLAPGELNPTVEYYISHLQVPTATFIISTGIAVTGLSWYGVRQ
jgi:hypothetical protein